MKSPQSAIGSLALRIKTAEESVTKLTKERRQMLITIGRQNARISDQAEQIARLKQQVIEATRGQCT